MIFWFNTYLLSVLSWLANVNFVKVNLDRGTPDSHCQSLSDHGESEALLARTPYFLLPEAAEDRLTPERIPAATR